MSRFSAIAVNLPSHHIKNVRISLPPGLLTSVLCLSSGIMQQVSLQKSLSCAEFDDLLRLQQVFGLPGNLRFLTPMQLFYVKLCSVLWSSSAECLLFVEENHLSLSRFPNVWYLPIVTQVFQFCSQSPLMQCRSVPWVTWNFCIFSSRHSFFLSFYLFI